MKKITFILLTSVIGLASCSKHEEAPLTKAQIKQKVDSIVAVRGKELDQLAHQDLQRRMKIEVKIKVDSMVHAMSVKNDSVLNAATAQKIKDSLAKRHPAK